MKLYLIKHKGKNWFGNLVGFGNEMTIGKDKFYTHFTFYRKKDAKKYLDTFKHKEYLEIVSAEIEESKQDNRKKYV